MSRLLAFDCDKIQAYVYASPRQRDIRLASRRLERVTEEVRKAAGDFGGDAVGVAAASGVVWFEKDGSGACELADLIRREFAAIGISCTVAVVDGDGGFAKLRELAELKLREKKDQLDRTVATVGSPLFVWCEATGVRAAEDVEHTEGGDRRLSLVVKREWYEATDDAVLDWEQQLADAMCVAREGLWKNTLCGDIDELATTYRDQGGEDPDGQVPVALIAADVNDTGRRFADFELDDFRKTSDALRQWLAQALAAAIGRPPECGKRLPAFPIYVGGDDLLVYVPQQDGLHFAQTLCQEFLKAQKDVEWRDNKGPLTLCVGVAFGKQRTPFRQLSEMAREAEGRAKRARRALHPDGDGPCYVEYDIMRGALPLMERAGETYPRTAGPFTVTAGDAWPQDSLAALLSAISRLRHEGFPSNKVKEWAAIAGEDADGAALLYHASVKNLRSEQMQTLKTVADTLAEPVEIGALPQRKRGERMECPLVDIAALWDVVKGGRD
ncbi:MAG: hypothetical protein AB7Y46_02945 [Armatimonadota bacterium]